MNNRKGMIPLVLLILGVLVLALGIYFIAASSS